MNDSSKIVLFDGDCSFCNFWVRFITKRSKKNSFGFISLQSDEGINIRKKYEISPEIDSVVFVEKNSAFTKSSAALNIIKYLKFPWKLLYIFIIIPVPVRNYLYDFIAKHRHKFFKENNSCSI